MNMVFFQSYSMKNGDVSIVIPLKMLSFHRQKNGEQSSIIIVHSYFYESQMIIMYGIFSYIYPINDPNVGKYTSTMDHLGIAWIFSASWWIIPRIVSRLFHPIYKWINPTKIPLK